jgi:hypothetical protein
MKTDYSLRVRWRIALLPGTGGINSSIRDERKVLYEFSFLNFRRRNFSRRGRSVKGLTGFADKALTGASPLILLKILIITAVGQNLLNLH